MIAALALLLAVQHDGHMMMPGMAMPAAKPAVRKPPAVKGSQPKRAAPTARPAKSQSKPVPPAADASPAMTMPAAMPGMAMLVPGPAADICAPEHAAMGHCRPPAPASETVPASGTALPAGEAPPPAPPTVSYADARFGAAAMAGSRDAFYREHGGTRFTQVMLNIAEAQFRAGHDGYRWDGEGWFGGDIDRLVVRSEGRGNLRGGVEDAEVQALWSHAVGPYFNLQAGARQDFRPRPARTYATIGIKGLAPYWFEVEGALFLSDRGKLSGRAEAYYDQRITQRLILQPRGEVNFALSDDAARRVGGGISDLELGLRLRYELAREFAPYVGVSWDRRLGDSARFARAAGEGASDVSLVAGVRFWF